MVTSGHFFEEDFALAKCLFYMHFPFEKHLIILILCAAFVCVLTIMSVSQIDRHVYDRTVLHCINCL